MKNQLSLILLFFLINASTTIAQSDVVYNLSRPDLPPTINLVGNLPTRFSVELRNRGQDCVFMISNEAFSCPNSDSLVFVNNKIEGTRATYPSGSFIFRIENENGDFTPLHISKSGIREFDGELTGTPQETTRPPIPPQRNIMKSLKVVGPQLLWQDALHLEKALVENDIDGMKSVLCKYFLIEGNYCNDGNSMPDTLYNTALENYFLKSVLPDLSQILNLESASGSSGINPESNIQNAGVENILSPTVILDAIATVIAKRLIDELNIAYLDRFRKFLNGNKEAQTLFPKTALYLGTFGTQYTIDYKNLLEGLRQNIFDDLKSLSSTGITYLKKYTAKELPNNKKDRLALAIMGLTIIEGLQKNEKPASIIHQIGNLDYGDYVNADTMTMVNWINFASRVSDYLRTEKNAGTWISGKNLKVFSENPRAVYILAGLIWQKEKATLNELLNLKNNSLGQKKAEKIVEIIYQSLAIIRDFHETFIVENKYKNPPSTEELSEKYFAFAGSLLEYLTQIIEIEGDAPELLKELPAIQASIQQLLQNIHEKKFVAAGTDFFALIQKIGLIDSNSKLAGEIMRYLSFGQNLVNAKNKEELIEAIEQAADPVGNYRLKRFYPFTVSITSLPGIGLGHEQHKANYNQDAYINNFGFTAPVGLALSWAKKDSVDNENKPKAHTSWTIYIPVLDVGAITSFRLRDQEANIPELEWENFISPGLGLSVGFKNSPLSIMGVAQYGPEAVGLDADNLEIRERLWRFNLSLNVDLHLWSIYTKPR